MKIDEAINLVKQVISAYKGNLQEHQALQTAMGVIENEIKKTKTKTEEKKVEAKKA